MQPCQGWCSIVQDWAAEKQHVRQKSMWQYGHTQQVAARHQLAADPRDSACQAAHLPDANLRHTSCRNRMLATKQLSL